MGGICVYIILTKKDIYTLKKYFKKKKEKNSTLFICLGGDFPRVIRKYLLYTLRKIFSYCTIR